MAQYISGIYLMLEGNESAVNTVQMNREPTWITDDPNNNALRYKDNSGVIHKIYEKPTLQQITDNGNITTTNISISGGFSTSIPMLTVGTLGSPSTAWENELGKFVTTLVDANNIPQIFFRNNDNVSSIVLDGNQFAIDSLYHSSGVHLVRNLDTLTQDNDIVYKKYVDDTVSSAQELIQSGEGYILKDRINQYKTLGSGAIDLSLTTSEIIYGGWSDAGAIGVQSFATGYNTKASGIASTAIGSNTLATAWASYAEGDNNEVGRAIQYHDGSIVTSLESFGKTGHAEGSSNFIYGNGHIEGDRNQAGAYIPSYNISGVLIDVNNFVDELNRLYSRIDNTDMGGGTPFNAEWIRLKYGLFLQNNNLYSGLNGIFGTYSHTEGGDNINVGSYGHIEGCRNNVGPFAASSHAEGYGNSVFASDSHVEGYINTVHLNSNASHAEGFRNEIGLSTPDNLGLSGATNSHIEGYENIIYATASTSHVEGYTNKAYSHCSHMEGTDNILNALSSFSHIEGAGNILHFNSPYSHMEGSFNRHFASSQAGHVEGTNNMISSGAESSHVEGYGNAVYMAQTHAEGGGNKAWGNSSHVEGFGNMAGTGRELPQNISGVFQYDLGRLEHDTYTGHGTHAEGITTISSAAGSHSEGTATIAGEVYHYTQPKYNTNGDYIYDEPYSSGTYYGENSHVEGNSTQTLSEGAHAEGLGTIAGSNIPSLEFSGISLVKSTVRSSSFDMAIPDQRLSKGIAAHAEGIHTQALGDASHSEGWNTIASGQYSHAEGAVTRAYGVASHAEGQGCVASGFYSHAGGFYTLATNNSMTAIGKYNDPQSDSIFEIGIGSGELFRYNGLRVNNSGLVFADEATLPMISGAINSVLITKEYADVNYTGSAAPLYGNSASRPTGTVPTGTMYFNTDLGFPMWYNGTWWVNATGAYLM